MAKQPFCCGTAIPSTFAHLLALLPRLTTHIVVSTGTTASAGLLSTFLTSTLIDLVYPSTLNAPLPAHVVRAPNGSYRAIVQVTKLVLTNDPSEPIMEALNEVYVPYGQGDRERIRPGEVDELRWVSWKEIDAKEAEWCIKSNGSEFDIGDGEHWMELAGAEKLWCNTHMSFWKLKAFIRET